MNLWMVWSSPVHLPEHPSPSLYTLLSLFSGLAPSPVYYGPPRGFLIWSLLYLRLSASLVSLIEVFVLWATGSSGVYHFASFILPLPANSLCFHFTYNITHYFPELNSSKSNGRANMKGSGNLRGSVATCSILSRAKSLEVTNKQTRKQHRSGQDTKSKARSSERD